MELKGQLFHKKVRQGFIALAENEPEKYAIIDSTNPIDVVEDGVHALIQERFIGSI